MAGMVALLVLAGTTVASTEQTPIESVKGTLAEVIQILDTKS